MTHPSIVRDTIVPLVLHLHAGGFVSAPVPGRITALEQLLVQAGATVVSLRYPLAPAHPFPQAIEAAYAALVELSQRRPLSGAKANKLVVAGAEAGGNIAAAVALMARDRGELELAGQILVSPMLCPRLATHSMRRAEAGGAGCRFAQGWRQYLAGAADAGHPYADPADARRLAGLPRALLITAADDPLHDETQAYARRLVEQGNDASLVLLPTPSNFPSALMHEAPEQAPWTRLASDALRRFLARAAYPSSPTETLP
jgi:acetyl esterase